VKVISGWGECTVSSAHYYTSGKHKFTVGGIIVTDKQMFIGFFWENFNYRGTHIGYDDYSRSYFCNNGYLRMRATGVPFGKPIENNDKVDVILDLTTSFGTVEYFINGNT
jgi:hypothetical protein